MSHFTGQHTEEQVLVVTRPHWIILLGKIVEVALLLFAAMAIWVLLQSFFAGLYAAFSPLLVLLLLLYLYAVFAFFFLSWAQYWFDVTIITNERIVKIDQRSMFNREISEFRISRIQDVRVEIRGLLATWLQFGDLILETAGEGPAFTFASIPHPENIKDIILYHQGQAPGKI